MNIISMKVLYYSTFADIGQEKILPQNYNHQLLYHITSFRFIKHILIIRINDKN